MPVRNAPPLFVVGETVWIRSYSTHRASVGTITEQLYRERDGQPMVAVELGMPYCRSWDVEENAPNPDSSVIVVESYRLEQIEW